MNEILDVLERLKLECDGSQTCPDCQFYTVSKNRGIKACGIHELCEALFDFPKYWCMERIKEVLSRDQL